jgi:ATP-binding cassette subfamily B protein
MHHPQRSLSRPSAFILSYVRHRLLSHSVIVGAVLLAVVCATATQYGVKNLVDALSISPPPMNVWSAFAVLVVLIAADNLLWRLAGWISSHSFVGVTGDLRRDLFQHLTGHSPTFFADRWPGMLTSRITAASNAVYTIENLFIWNVLPPCVATVAAIALLVTVSTTMAAGLSLVAGAMVFVLFRLAAAGQPLHRDFAEKAAVIDGEMVDVISNMPLVRAFVGRQREHYRYDTVIGRETAARRRSLLYLERLRLLHAVFTIVLTVGLLAWAIVLWQKGAATTGDVILCCTLGLTILHATRDLAVALVEATQHLARLAEAIPALLVPHELSDHPAAIPLKRNGSKLSFRNVTFRYTGGSGVFENFDLDIAAGQRVGIVGRSGTGKSTLFSLIQRLHDIQNGRILLDGQDIAKVTQDSLRQSIAVVPQDVSLFQRSIMENIRYSRPDATDAMVLAAAEAARCTFLDKLPDGLDTMVGAHGLKLSGGQRQRIAIARAFLKDAPLLLLDEATSSLDIESEEAIRHALGRLMQGRTVLAIAHRLSTLRGFDRVVVLKRGQVTEDGAPDQLMRRNGPYRRLVDSELDRLSRTAA